MEVIHVASVVVAALVCGCGLVFALLKRVNEWVYGSSLGRQRASLLPPGHMGWPLIDRMWTFFRAFNNGRPDSFLDSFISRFGRTCIYRTFLYGCPSIIVSNPEMCKRVLTNDQHSVPGYRKATKKIFGNRSFHGISLPEHKRLRHLTVAPINGMEVLSLFVGKIEDILVTTMARWAELGRPIPLMNEMNKVTYKVILVSGHTHQPPWI
ncbi:ent-kaurenoic acid oxidase-like [Syzygium oleosum]|uniref:ent-kaurenoic acid oxidase-like n=1 Tax=Syzygium oleosum TaxID=219896 RepID=UPI0024B8F6B0|nr:ent-kaurenoic acid oxidase-like [Syzygium oleosum]